jgi:hypothetical protein
LDNNTSNQHHDTFDISTHGSAIRLTLSLYFILNQQNSSFLVLNYVELLQSLLLSFEIYF